MKNFLIFLDFDGVLNSIPEWNDPEHMLPQTTFEGRFGLCKNPVSNFGELCLFLMKNGHRPQVVVASAWKRFFRLIEQGKLPEFDYEGSFEEVVEDFFADIGVGLYCAGAVSPGGEAAQKDIPSKANELIDSTYCQKFLVICDDYDSVEHDDSIFIHTRPTEGGFNSKLLAQAKELIAPHLTQRRKRIRRYKNF